jgi:16S rRNA (uracil1498-N3)-methyltransferase
VPARAHAPDADASGQTLALSDGESAHLGRVLRLGVGDEVRVFAGRGRAWHARIVGAGAGPIRVELGATATAAPEPRVRYTVAMAVLKGDGTDEMIRDAVMMGAVRVRPVVAARSEVRLSAIVRAERHARWQRIALASVKQCGRAVVPLIDPPGSVDGLLDADGDGIRALLVEPAIAADGVALVSLPPPPALTLAIGPEGGWAPEEVARARDRGWTLVRLGPRTLRASAVALAALAGCQAVWEEAGPHHR